MEQIPQKGRLLISEPFMGDPYFKRTVVLLCEHDKKTGSFGLVLNRQLDLYLADALPEIADFNAPLYYGGPVEPETLHFLHSYGDLFDDSVEVGKGIYWGGDFEKLKSYMNTRQISPSNIRFYMGYSGWNGTQLTDEMKDSSWIVAPSQAQYIFAQNADQLWRQVLRDMGDDHYRIMSHFPEYPSLN